MTRHLFGQIVQCLFLVIIISGWSLASHGKDLSSRLGVGYSNQFSEDLPSLAVQYSPNLDFGFSAALGVDTEDENSKFGFLAKFYRIIFTEPNMNFYMGAGAGILSREIQDETDSGFELSGFVGGEFFFSGLESLGFSFEAGVGITSIDDVRFRTIGQHPLKAGIIFYF